MTKIDPIFPHLAHSPIRIGIIGTGFVAKTRATNLQTDSRAKLVAVAGHSPTNTESFGQTYQMEAIVSWRKLIEREDIDLVIICNVNVDHGAIARAALDHGKHVIVEYPLALDPNEAESIINLAASKNLLVHVEHIELLGGLHNAIKQNLHLIGNVFYARYVTISPQNPAPRTWSYQKSLWGFPLISGLSRINRFTNLFGQVQSINCSTKYWPADQDYFNSVWCQAELRFKNQVIGEIVYGKGETFWRSENEFILYGDQGILHFTPEIGHLIQGENQKIIEVGTRRGLFAKDNTMVLDYLIDGKPLYIQANESLYALKVADLGQKSSTCNQLLIVD